MTAVPADAPAPAEAPAPRTRPRLVPGWRVVAGKELADHFLSVRFTILLVLLGLAAAGAVFAAAGGIRDVAPTVNVDSVFIRIFTVPPEERVPAFFQLIAFLAPLLGIAFGFDAVNGERAQGTLPRLLSQPIHRDDVINGKFVAGLTVIGAMLAALTMIVSGLGLVRLGIAPSADEVGRIVAWLALTIVYVGFWLGLATLCSVALRRAATSALVAIFAWLVLTLFFGLLIGLVADAVAPLDAGAPAEEQIANAELQQNLARISPQTLYTEATTVLLTPEQRTLSEFLTFGQALQLQSALPSELTLGQSLLLAVPQVVILVGLTLLCFVAAYILFMRQEVRA